MPHLARYVGPSLAEIGTLELYIGRHLGSKHVVSCMDYKFITLNNTTKNIWEKIYIMLLMGNDCDLLNVMICISTTLSTMDHCPNTCMF